MLQRTPNAARLGIYWFGIQAVWGALLGVSLQARSTELAPGWTLAAFAMLAAWGAAVAGVTQIAAGVASDRFRLRGSKRVEFYATGALVASAGIFWFYGAHSFAQLFASVVVVQIGMNLATGPYQAAIPDFIPDNRAGAASSWMAGLQSAGNAVGAVAASLIALPGLTAAALVTGLLASCAFTVTYARRLLLMPAHAQPARITRAYIDLFISRGFMYLGFYTLLDYVFFFLQGTLGAANGKAFTGYTILIVTAAGTAGAALSARPADRFDRRGLVSIGGGLFAGCTTALLLQHAFPAIALCAAGAGAAWGVFLTADWALGCRFLPRSHAASAMGIWNLALLLPQVAAPLVATLAIGILHAQQNNQAARIAFALSVVEVIVGALWVWRLPALPNAVKNPPGGNTS